MALPLRILDTEPEAPRVIAGPAPLTVAMDPTLAHTIAHDLRSPLTAVQMCAESLATEEDPARRARYSEMILGQTRCIAWALDDLVALADEQYWRAEGLGQIDMDEALATVFGDMEALLSLRNIQVVHPRPARPAQAWGHYGGLRRALRGMAEAVATVVPPGGDLEAETELGGKGMGPDDVTVTLTARAPTGAPARHALRPNLPWHRLPLLTAHRITIAHEGRLEEVRGEDYVAARMVLPSMRPTNSN